MAKPDTLPVRDELAQWQAETAQIAADQEYFTEMLSQADSQEFTGRRVAGPHYMELQTVLGAFNTALQQLDPAITAEYIKPKGYMSPDVRATIDVLPREVLQGIGRIKYEKRMVLTDLGTQWAGLDNREGVDPEAFDVPPYRAQGGREAGVAGTQGCFNACFRMVYEGITDDKPAERAVTAAVREVHGSHLADDESYLKAFATPAFRDRFAKKVDVISVTGADIATLGKIASRAKQKWEEAKVFSVVSLESETAAGESVWHANVLTGAEDDAVIAHDPATKGWGKENREIPARSFYPRWAIGLNRAHVIISRDAVS